MVLPRVRMGKLVALVAAVTLPLLVLGPPGAGASADTVGPPTKVLTFVEENHTYQQMRDQMPYLFSLAQTYGYSTNWHAIMHPSLPNYVAMVGGSTFGITKDGLPAAMAPLVGDAKSVFDQAIEAGGTAKTYAESMPTNCKLTNTTLYAVRHNPWAYFGASRDRCNTFDVPMGTPTSGAMASDIASNSLPNAGFAIPNLINDAHNSDLPTADNWLKGWLPQMLASDDFTSGRLVIILTADEDDRTVGNKNKVLTVVLWAGLQAKASNYYLTHYSLTRYYAQVLGVTPLLNGATAPDMKTAFGL
jgi:phosphatidylinositol-3-phosphatase